MKMRNAWNASLLVCAAWFSTFAYAVAPPAHLAPRHILVFDLDRTLFDPTQRIEAIKRDVGKPWMPAHFSDPTKPHGQRFLHDPRYLAYDVEVPGAAETVAYMQKRLNADILYLTGRYRDPMWQGTVEQLRKGNFPGFGLRSHLRSRVKLQLRERADQRGTIKYKVAELARIAPPWKIIAIVDDSGRNLEAFWSAGYTPETGTQLIRMTGLNPLQNSEIQPAWMCLNGFTDPRDLFKLDAWIKSIASCDQQLLF